MAPSQPADLSDEALAKSEALAKEGPRAPHRARRSKA
jgi:hypothetical protein